MKRTLLLSTLVLLAAQSSTPASADTHDMWFQLAEKTGTFSPHQDFCEASEVFIPIDGATLGFCIEADDRAAATWESAKETCGEAGKRLPEPAEFAYACKNYAASLTDETNGWEWVSNNSYPLSSGGVDSVASTIMGYSACTSASWGTVGNNSSGAAGAAESLTFRCVR